MPVQINNEIWQVAVGGNIYEAPLDELPVWIGEGSLQPEDKVRKGNLRWIEAGKVPVLVPFFNTKEKGEKIAVVQTLAEGTDANRSVETRPDAPTQPTTCTVDTEPVPKAVTVRADLVSANSGCCLKHHDLPAEFVCTACEAELCCACPMRYGGSVHVCPECGSMCRTVAESTVGGGRSAAEVDRTEPFGLGDLGRAFGHPLRFRSSLIFGGLMFMAFTIGQSASGWGGFVFLGASLFCMLLANMLTFGVLAHTVENFVQGRLEADFMPSFEDFSFWDDVILPFILSIGVYLTSFGPFLLVAVIGGYMIASSANDQMMKYQHELAQVPGTHYYSPDRTVEQSKEVREVLEKVRQQNERNLARHRALGGQNEQMARSAEGVAQQPAHVPGAADENAEVAADDQGGTAGNTAVTPVRTEREPVVAGILKLAAPLVVIGALALLWGLIYFPAACAVAGYSRSFLATLNPAVGLDTMKRLGVDYLKILLMGFMLLILSGIVGLAVSIVFLPFDLAGIGNLPATAVGSLFTFYISVVFSCILGYALFKSADRLKLYR